MHRGDVADVGPTPAPSEMAGIDHVVAAVMAMPGVATASCSVDGGPYAACATSFTADLSAAADGPHTISVRNADAAGNQSAATSQTYDLDRSAPGAPTITSPPSPSNVTTPSWGITTEAGSTTECRLDELFPPSYGYGGFERKFLRCRSRLYEMLSQPLEHDRGVDLPDEIGPLEEVRHAHRP